MTYHKSTMIVATLFFFSIAYLLLITLLGFCASCELNLYALLHNPDIQGYKTSKVIETEREME